MIDNLLWNSRKYAGTFRWRYGLNRLLTWNLKENEIDTWQFKVIEQK